MYGVHEYNGIPNPIRDMIMALFPVPLPGLFSSFIISFIIISVNINPILYLISSTLITFYHYFKFVFVVVVIGVVAAAAQVSVAVVAGVVVVLVVVLVFCFCC